VIYGNVNGMEIGRQKIVFGFDGRRVDGNYGQMDTAK
jgi:hypothetical protein